LINRIDRSVGPLAAGPIRARMRARGNDPPEDASGGSVVVDPFTELQKKITKLATSKVAAVNSRKMVTRGLLRVMSRVLRD
jgi:hypothetical protein